MKKIIKLWIVISISAAVLSGCGFMSAYEAPKGKQPYALLKLKYKYNAIKPGTTLGARMHIRHDAKSKDDSYTVAFNKSYGSVRAKSVRPKIAIEAVKVHPGKKTDIKMAVYFYWYTTSTYTTYVNGMPMVQTRQIYNEAACTTKMSFIPRANKNYLLDYSNPNVNRDCKATAYQQIKHKNGKFKLKRVAKSSKS